MCLAVIHLVSASVFQRLGVLPLVQGLRGRGVGLGPRRWQGGAGKIIMILLRLKKLEDWATGQQRDNRGTRGQRDHLICVQHKRQDHIQ